MTDSAFIGALYLLKEGYLFILYYETRRSSYENSTDFYTRLLKFYNVNINEEPKDCLGNNLFNPLALLHEVKRTAKIVAVCFH